MTETENVRTESSGNGVIRGQAADRPIQSETQDRLGRTRFANQLAVAISRWRESDSLVIALYGSWGIGKSSIKNLVLEQIARRWDSEVEILQFNPWQWRGHGEMSAAFFREVLTRLGAQPSRESSQKVIKSLRRYAAYLGLGTVLLGGARGIVALALAAVGTLTVVSPVLLSQEHTQSFLAVLGLSALAIAAVLQWGQAVLERFAIWRELGLSEPLSLEGYKKKVVEALNQYDKTLLVVQDDIDRLTPSEIQTVFQLVKANADFPRFVYLLLFQRDVVEKALADLVKGEGGAYLEKIVQIGFDVPPARQDEIDKILFEGLDALLAQFEGLEVEQTYWGNVYLGGLRHFFQDLRDVKRFLGSLEFHMNLLRTKNTLDVNPVDLIAMDTVRLFAPEAYHRIRNAKAVLTGQISEDSANKKEAAASIQLILDGMDDARKAATRALLQELFPGTAFAFGGMSYGSSSRDQWTRDLRVCSEQSFDRYFEFALTAGEISRYEVKMLLGMTSNAKDLSRELRRLAGEGKLIAAFDHLDVNNEGIQLEHAVDTIVALFDVAELLPESAPGLSLNPHWTIQRIAYQLLRREADPDRREEMVERILSNTTGLGMAVLRVSLESDAKERAKDPKGMIVRESKVTRLQKLCVERIEEAAANGRLMGQRELAHILYRWRDWGTEDKVRNWVTNMVSSPEGALALLRTFVHRGTTQTFGDRVARVRHYLKYSELEKFVEMTALEKQIAKIQVTKLGEADRKVVEAFNNAANRWRLGKPEGDFGWDENE